MSRCLSLLAAFAGLGVCAYLAVEPLLSGAGGCVHGWFFDCAKVRHSAAATLLGVPVWAWGGAWFVAVAALTWRAERLGPRPRLAALLVVVGGWMHLAWLRGVELFVLHAACLLCWTIALAGVGAGLHLLMHTMPARRRPLALALLALALVVSFFAAALLPEPPAPPDARTVEIPGWQWAPPQPEPFTAADLMRCGPDTPTLVFIFDPECPHCDEFLHGTLASDLTAQITADHCRVVVPYEEITETDLIAEAPETPAVILLNPGATVVGHAAGAITEDDLIDLITRGFLL